MRRRHSSAFHSSCFYSSFRNTVKKSCSNYSTPSTRMPFLFYLRNSFIHARNKSIQSSEHFYSMSGTSRFNPRNILVLPPEHFYSTPGTSQLIPRNIFYLTSGAIPFKRLEQFDSTLRNNSIQYLEQFHFIDWNSSF